MFRVMNCGPDWRDGNRNSLAIFRSRCGYPDIPNDRLKLRLNGHSTDWALPEVSDRLPAAQPEEVSNGSFLIL
jgi:hypothetical protein